MSKKRAYFIMLEMKKKLKLLATPTCVIQRASFEVRHKLLVSPRLGFIAVKIKEDEHEKVSWIFSSCLVLCGLEHLLDLL